MDQYKLEAQKGNGTFSVVFMATSLRTNNNVAIKCMKKKFDSIQKVKKLKEIQALNILSQHQNIIKLIEVLYDEPTGKLALVFQLMEMNLYECMKNKKINISKIKFYMFQVLKAIDFMHRKGIFHRDIKPENILVRGDLVKVADLGSCKGKHSPQPYTQYISTRWYRAPQCLMTDGYYTQKMDIWGFGCVLFELITKYPLFPGKDQLDQVHRIHHILGTPKQQLLDRFKSKASHMDFNFAPKKGTGLEKLLPGNTTSDLKDLLVKLLAYDPVDRISAQQALKHEFFSEFSNSLSTQKQFRSTFFTVKHSSKFNQKSEQKDLEESKILKDQKKLGLSKGKKAQLGLNSKNTFQKHQQQIVLPKLPVLQKSFGVSELAKKTFYKKYNQVNQSLIHNKKS